MTDFFSDESVRIIEALSNPVRLLILDFLNDEGFGTLTSIKKMVEEKTGQQKKVSPSVINFHLKVLMRAEMISRAKYDSKVFKISDFGRNVINTMKTLLSKRRISTGWGPSL